MQETINEVPVVEQIQGTEAENITSEEYALAPDGSIIHINDYQAAKALEEQMN